MKATQPIEQRARGAVARLLVKILQVPSIYFEAPWPSARHRTDILALDSAGVGDVHVVEIKQTLDDALRAVPETLNIPAQFRWVAFYNSAPLRSAHAKMIQRLERAPLFTSQGMGRVGIIEVHLGADHPAESLTAKVLVPAERFAGSFYDEAEKFAKAHKPDIMFR